MISCSIDLTNRCQNKCRFCHWAEFLNGEVIDFSLYKSLINDLKKMGVKSIVFSGGGEPLLHRKFRNIVQNSLDFRLGLFTNGIWLHKYMDLLNVFDWIKVSLDAGSRRSYERIKGSDSFGRVVRNIIRAKELTDVSVGWVLCEENCKEIFDLENLIGIQVNIKRDINTVKRKVSIESCKMSEDLGIVTASGKVYYCPLKRYNEKYLLGDLNTDKMSEIWGRRDKIVPNGCDDCRFSNSKHEYFL